MSALDEVRERDAEWSIEGTTFTTIPATAICKSGSSSVGWAVADRRFLLSQLDALQTECEKQKDGWGVAFRLAIFHQERANKAEAELSHLKAAVKAAGPALEAGASQLDSAADEDYNNYRADKLIAWSKQLRAIVGVVK